VVHGELRDHEVPHEEDLAVAHVRDREASAAGHDRDGDRRPHALQLHVRLAAGVDGAVRLRDPVEEVLLRLGGDRARRRLLDARREDLGAHRGGHLARVVPAHPVADDRDSDDAGTVEDARHRAVLVRGPPPGARDARGAEWRHGAQRPSR
jgi:hypothetical protein